jgi:hypothetical protein
MSDPSAPPASGLVARTETFNLHLEITFDGGTIEEFETNFRDFGWHVPSAVWFSEPTSGLGAHLALNAFETTIRDRSGDLMHVVVGGIADLHNTGAVDLGAEGTVDVRALQLSSVSLYIGVTGSATIDPSTGSGSVNFGPSFSLSFGGTAHP